MNIIKTLAAAAALALAMTGGAMAQAGLDLGTVTEETALSVMRITELAAAGAIDPADLDAAVADNPEGLAEFHATVGENAVIVDYLEAQGFAVADVVGISGAEDGGLVILVDDR